ncbi:hypothetical protein [Verrucosispora sp. WMMD573]|uniref:hypothetical protein n=1 Tax=Verrucosispora sp. WMMD573 TaxID=3015149 RepID=UPI00248A9A4C|nr:hypothetical protein [Verrucosispora sp. WMMD573]WBB52434.1 hypothetical protein O7601_17765 [Verrucosispora sp. WMMD573]
MVQFNALLAAVGQVPSQQQQQPGFVLSRRVQTADQTKPSAKSSACHLTVSPAESTLPIG